MSFGALAFLNPWILAGLATLPVIYWLLRTVPPTPKQITFPPTRILVGIENQEKTAAKSPWWLTLLRLLAAAFVILALADPLLNPTREQALSGDGPLVLVVDNSWASAAHWGDRKTMMERIVSNAEANNKAVMIVPTAPLGKQANIKLEAPSTARVTLAALKPQPFAPSHSTVIAAAKSAIDAARPGATDANVVWLTDGIAHEGSSQFADDLAALASSGTFSVVEGNPANTALGVTAGLGPDGSLVATVLRANGNQRTGVLHALSARNERLGEAAFQLAAGEQQTQITFELPLELRNQVTRVVIADEPSSGAVSLLDARAQRQRVALFSGESLERSQPLLAALYYVQKALLPFAEVVLPKAPNLTAGIEQAIEQNATVIMMADIGRLSGRVAERVEKWVARGGVLVRFAGPRLEKGGDKLLPVPLRAGGRTLGGALSWSQPQALAPFDEKSAFVGLDVPDDVLIRRQVLADPSQTSPDTQIWASLQDGTPLVTAQRRGEGRVILFHVTANSDWSNLPISGLFVEMLRRVATMGSMITASSDEGGDISGAATSSATTDETVLAPQQTLDGFGALQTPPPTAQSLSIADFVKASPSLKNPPGYYGAGVRPRALNVLNEKSELKPLSSLPSSAQRQTYKSETATPLKPWLFALAFALIVLDMVAVLFLQSGGLSALRRANKPATGAAATIAFIFATSILALGLLSTLPTSALAQDTQPGTPQATQAAPDTDIAKALQATRDVTFGYVLTGDLETDEISKVGLKGLGTVLNFRTAVSPGDPIGVDIVKDEISLYPMLYWPILKDAQALPDQTLAKIDAYMKKGGMIIFDTRDHGQGLPVGVAIEGSGTSALRRLLGRLDIPRLEPVPQEHVLTKSFYLLRTFPGRWDGGQLWVEAGSVADGNDGESRQARRADGVTSILITSNDFASAWALDRRGAPLYPVSPGGEPQREMAFRTGINIVMHTLTGNYKADQVHVPALLERFGQ